MNYEKFCHDIDSIAYILKRFIEVNDIQRYKIAPNFALFEYFTKPSPMNANKAFSYFPTCTQAKPMRTSRNGRGIVDRYYQPGAHR